ncbi:MAG: ribonuclease Z [Prevotellaceae bacterium]|jgi:ribonuclease Z|nr:ribonuclease Z [Prevotellaceae bacterium]
MSFSVTILGCSAALPTANRFPSAQLVSIRNRRYLVDCGEGAQMQLCRYGFSALQVNHVFISHLHGDHMFGLFGLISTMSMMGRRSPLHIYAPCGMQQILDDHLRYFGEGVSYSVEVHELCCERQSIILEDKHITVSTFPLYHRVPTCGFLFCEKTPPRNIFKEAIAKYSLPLCAIIAIKNGSDYTLPDGEVIPNEQLTYQPYAPRTYAYCSDTIACREVALAVQGADLLYHEATFADDMRDFAINRGHATARQAAQLARDAGVKRLIIGHFSSRYRSVDALVAEAQQVFPNTCAAKDGATFFLNQDLPFAD